MEKEETYTLKDIPDYGQKYKFDEFVKMCKDGWLIDYDGCGNYATEDKILDIIIYPSDIIDKTYRKDFDYVIWFNK
jgi:hypothetical protein